MLVEVTVEVLIEVLVEVLVDAAAEEDDEVAGGASVASVLLAPQAEIAVPMWDNITSSAKSCQNDNQREIHFFTS